MKALLLTAALVLTPLVSNACEEAGKAADIAEPAAVSVVETRLPGPIATGTSSRTCHDDLNCPPGDACLNGVCVVAGRCTGDIDCGPGRRCVDGRCRR